MVLDTTQEQLIEELGHDGSEILWPQYNEPLCRRTFHVQEFTVCAFNRGKYVIEFLVTPFMHPNPEESINKAKEKLDKIINLQTATMSDLLAVRQLLNDQCIPYYQPFDVSSYMRGNKGVLLGEVLSGRRHAVAWDGNQIYDPAIPSIYPYENFHVEGFYMVR